MSKRSLIAPDYMDVIQKSLKEEEAEAAETRRLIATEVEADVFNESESLVDAQTEAEVQKLLAINSNPNSNLTLTLAIIVIGSESLRYYRRHVSRRCLPRNVEGCRRQS